VSIVGTDPEYGGSWVGRGMDRLFVLCKEPSDNVPLVGRGLDEGRHDVEMRATLPGSDEAVVSSSVVVELRCPEEDGVDASGGGCGCLLTY